MSDSAAVKRQAVSSKMDFILSPLAHAKTSPIPLISSVPR
jgi:hypothetical protein